MRDADRAAPLLVLIGWTGRKPVVAGFRVELADPEWIYRHHDETPAVLVLGPLAVATLPAARLARTVVKCAPVVIVSTGITEVSEAAHWLTVPGIDFVAPAAIAAHVARIASSIDRSPSAGIMGLLAQMALEASRRAGRELAIGELDPAFLVIARVLPSLAELTNVGSWSRRVAIRPSELYAICRRAVGLSTKDVLSDYVLAAATAAIERGASAASCAARLGFADAKGLRKVIARAELRRVAAAAAEGGAPVGRRRSRVRSA